MSVLVVTYHSNWNKIKLTLNSILKQKNVDYEIVISDDGSEDNQFDKIRAYFRKRHFEDYMLVEHSCNQGTVKNIIDGLNHCKGKYVKDFGPGDLFRGEDALYKMVSFLHDNQYEIGFCLMQGYTVLLNGIYRKVPYVHPFDLSAYKKNNLKMIQKNEVFYSDHVSGAALFFETKVYLEYLKRIEPYVVYEEDIFQVMAALDARPIHFLDEKLIWYETGFGISTSGNSEFAKLLEKDVNSFYEFIFEAYKDNIWVKKRKRISWCYRIRNLYLRTLVRFLANPDAMRYLISHFVHVMKDEYRCKMKQ